MPGIAAAQAKDTGNIFLADPAIFKYANSFYLYGTVGGNPNNGFSGYESTDLHHWRKAGAGSNEFALKKGDVFGQSRFWAPQLFRIGDSVYIAYAADEHIAIASAKSPGGPFKQSKMAPLEAPVRQIDPFVFKDDDGKIYLYHVRLTNGNRIFVAEMQPDLSAIKPATLQECISATQPWENTANASWPVTEGPSILHHKGLYYLFYSANDFRNPDYAVGYATSKSPLGPWEKYAQNPIISKKNLGINGTGHGDFVVDGQQKLWYVLHTHFSDAAVSPRRTALISIHFEADPATGIDKAVADEKSFYFLQSGQ